MNPEGSSGLRDGPVSTGCRVSPALPLGVRLSYDWGFVRSTRAEHGDAVDACCCGMWRRFKASWRRVARSPSSRSNSTARKALAVPGTIASLAVRVEARRQAGLAAGSLSDRVRRELEQFFLAATPLEAKDVAILGWADADAATRSTASRVTTESRSASVKQTS